jgi:hypothetical protein
MCPDAGVVRLWARRAGDRVEQRPRRAQFHQPPALDGEFGDGGVVLRRAVEGGGEDRTFTERRMSVTSSDRSSTSTTIRWHSGWSRDGARDHLQHHRPAAFGGDTINPLALPIGIPRSITRVQDVRLGLQLQPLCGTNGVSL